MNSPFNGFDVPYIAEDISSDFTFTPESQMNEFYPIHEYTGGYSGVPETWAENAFAVQLPIHSTPYPQHPVEHENQLLIDNMHFTAMSGHARTWSASTHSTAASSPTPSQLLEMLSNDASSPREHFGAYEPTNEVPLYISPSALYTPVVSPAHSRHGSSHSLMTYEQVYPSPFTSGQAQYGAEGFLSPPNQFLAVHTPPCATISPALLSSPSISRRPSSISMQPSPAIISVDLSHRSPSPPSCPQHYRTASTVSRSDDSGSSSYSPYGYGRDLSTSSAYSPVYMPNTPHTHAGSLSATSQRGASPASSVGSSSAVGGAFSKFSINSPTDPAASSKKRKRASVSSLSTQRVLLSMDSSEDEYVAGVDVDASDEDYEEDFGTKRGKGIAKQARGRKVKKQKLVSGTSCSAADENHSVGWNHSDMANCRVSTVPHGADIKVDKLLPINRETESCPHCGFIPGNRRYSDLKRHWEAHLVKEAKEKVRWVCLECGDVRDVVVNEEQEDGTVQQRWISEYVPKVPVLKNYTRKDSARRHWKLDHGEKGAVWHDGLVCQVDRIYEEGPAA